MVMLRGISKSWSDFKYLVSDISEDSQVIEIGAGARPYLSKEFVLGKSIDYTISDISSSELAKSNADYCRRIAMDMEADIPTFYEGRYDLVFSKMVLEHLQRPEVFHKNVLKLVSNRGVIIHFYACKFGLPGILNLILPEKFVDWLVYKIQGRDPIMDHRFTAYYRRCLGPVPAQIKWWNKLGYEIVDFKGFVGHTYLSRYRVLGWLEKLWTRFLLTLNSAWVCSSAIVVLKVRK